MCKYIENLVSLLEETVFGFDIEYLRKIETSPVRNG